MSLLRNKKRKDYLITARCNVQDSFRSLYMNKPRSDAEKDNVRVESVPCNRARLRYFYDSTPYTYTRNKEGNLMEYIKH